jgi:drug/metabolite transporter (DMT)-like permease
MKLAKLLGIALVAAGVLALVYKGFSYTEETHGGAIGRFELSVKKKERVSIPTWAGVVAIAAGAALLLVPGKR